MIAKLLLQNTFFVVALGALLFASAGTLDWPAAWVFLVVSAIVGPACGLWLAKTDPAQLAERMRPTFHAGGPYAFVRHPMYSGIMLFFVAVPLLLGSWCGVAIAPVFAILFAIRARIEERALVEGLPDYADYAARVRYRLVPGLW
jgi:protein-S-isoprenylcysteine O-methyltransferase Ste14